MDRRFFLHGLAASIAGPVMAGGPEQSARPVMRPSGPMQRALPDAQDLIRAAKLSGQTSLVFYDVNSNRILASSSPLRRLPPASVAKTLTALYAFEKLGPEFCFKTQLGYTGTLVDGRLTGDLVLVGGGDPTLTTHDLAQLAAEAKAAGLQEITGRLLVWGGRLPQSDMIDASQPDHVGYNPAISGMNLNFNRVHFEWRAAQAGYETTLQARTEQYRPSVEVIAMDVVDRASPVFAYRGTAKTEQWSVARGALGKSGARWLPVRVPVAYTADVMTTLLRSHGIVAKEYAHVTSLPVLNVLSSVQSRPLIEICSDMLKYSTNLTAECVGLMASGASSLRESAKAMSQWVEQEFGARNIDLVDHSGLGDESRVAARDIVRVLAASKSHDALRPILKPFKLRDGANDADAFDVKAKTGTLNFVSGLAGYATVPTNPDGPVAFAIFSADMPTRHRLSKAERERPPGGRAWSRRARVLQSRLIRQFGAAHDE